MVNKFNNNLGDKDVLSDNLNRLFNATDKTQQELADYLGVGKSTITEWVKGRNYPRIDRLQKIADFFSVDITSVVEDYKLPSNIVPLQKARRIPILGTIACGEPIWAEQNYEGYFIADYSIKATL